MGGIQRLTNNGAGVLSLGGDLFLESNGQYRDLQLADFNGDGPLDIIVTLSSGAVAVLQGTGR